MNLNRELEEAAASPAQPDPDKLQQQVSDLTKLAADLAVSGTNVFRPRGSPLAAAPRSSLCQRWGATGLSFVGFGEPFWNVSVDASPLLVVTGSAW